MATATIEMAYQVTEKTVFIRVKNQICRDSQELLDSELFWEILKRFVDKLRRKDSLLLGIFKTRAVQDHDLHKLRLTLKALARRPGAGLATLPEGSPFLEDRRLFCDFVEHLYNYWRHFDRFLICDAEGTTYDQHPFRTFNQTVEALMHLVRGTYRDIQENISRKHPRIYRQVSAGAEIATIALPKAIRYPAPLYQRLNAVPVIREILIYPPLVLNPPMNKRRGRFRRIDANPLEGLELNPRHWLCYPAKVGSLVVMVYFCEKFFDLGLSLCNLFELADDNDLERIPDAVYIFGKPDVKRTHADSLPAVFYEDPENGMLVGSVPDWDDFGYFGYLKKMILTLHNIKKMKAGLLPFHGALVKIYLKTGRPVTILSIGDTGAGKSETLEALRHLAEEAIQDIQVIADDMGSLEIGPKGEVLGYGTEIGAFLRLDDLQPGYAFGQMDRAIIMSPNRTNARIVLPVTDFENVIQGHRVDYVFYMNNYEEIDEDHPVISRFHNPEEALKVFREGTVMSKGTTASTGLVHSYFANIFGPVQYKELHEDIAQKYFDAMFRAQIFVGEMRTRLGIPGWERKGPEEAAKALIQLIGKE